MRAQLLAATAVLIAFAASAAAEERYRLEKSADGYVRMDTRTGAMSICQESGGQLVCRAAADERTAYEDDIGRLQEGIDALEKRVAALENRAIPEMMLPSEENFEKSLSYMEQFFRRFLGVVKDFEKDGTNPQKT
ncbi:MAG: hypothetical protein KF723_15455 [Rhizobiaceae bacterium]|nr:hypothetical protein [Rhizobiaceae bacterium]